MVAVKNAPQHNTQNETAEKSQDPMPKDVELLTDAVQRPIDPFLQTGTMDTSGTGGVLDNSVAAVSPVFAAARRRDLEVAARALDPDDDDVPADLVVLPEGSVTVTGTTKTAEEGKGDVYRALGRTSKK